MDAATVDHRCMKTEDHAAAAGHSVGPARWQEAFEVLMGRIAGRFARVEPRRRVRGLVLGLLSDPPRKICRSIAEWTAEATPGGMQHLLGRPLRYGPPAPLVRLATPPPGPSPGRSLPPTSHEPDMKITNEAGVLDALGLAGLVSEEQMTALDLP